VSTAEKKGGKKDREWETFSFCAKTVRKKIRKSDRRAASTGFERKLCSDGQPRKKKKNKELKNVERREILVLLWVDKALRKCGRSTTSTEPKLVTEAQGKVRKNKGKRRPWKRSVGLFMNLSREVEDKVHTALKESRAKSAKGFHTLTFLKGGAKSARSEVGGGPWDGNNIPLQRILRE